MSEGTLHIGPPMPVCEVQHDDTFIVDGHVYRYERSLNGCSFGERVMTWSYVEGRYVDMMDNWSPLYQWSSDTIVNEVYIR